MKKLTRRKFASQLLTAGLIPSAIAVGRDHSQPRTPEDPKVPPEISGHTLSEDETALANKFLSDHRKSMEPLRARDLPNSLLPFFALSTPMQRREKRK